MIIKNNYTLLAFIATLFTWIVTTLGSSMVFFFKKINKNILDICLGVSAGIMLSASFFSLLNPAFEYVKDIKKTPSIIVTIGFLLGCMFICLINKIFQKKSKKKINQNTFLLLLSITMHNIPEGLAIGIAFGTVKYGLGASSLTNAILLSIAIGIQNFPEGAAVSLPLRREKYSRIKSFIYGSLSAIVEPIFGVIGALLTLKIKNLMPLFLSFAAGAMVLVIIQELIPESQTSKNKTVVYLFTIAGFAIMMILDTMF